MATIALPPIRLTTSTEIGLLFLQKWDAADRYRMVWVVGTINGAKRWLPCRLFEFHPDQETHPGEVLSFGENEATPAWVSRQIAVQHLRTMDARNTPSSSQLQPPILPPSFHNIERYNNRRGCAFYEYLGTTNLGIPPVPTAGAALGVLFLQKLNITALEYHAAWMVAESDGVKGWVRCGPFVLHPDQKTFSGKVLALRRNTTPSPAWVLPKIAIDMAARDSRAFHM